MHGDIELQAATVPGPPTDERPITPHDLDRLLMFWRFRRFLGIGVSNPVLRAVPTILALGVWSFLAIINISDQELGFLLTSSRYATNFLIGFTQLGVALVLFVAAFFLRNPDMDAIICQLLNQVTTDDRRRLQRVARWLTFGFSIPVHALAIFNTSLYGADPRLAIFFAFLFTFSFVLPLIYFALPLLFWATLDLIPTAIWRFRRKLHQIALPADEAKLRTLFDECRDLVESVQRLCKIFSSAVLASVPSIASQYLLALLTILHGEATTGSSVTLLLTTLYTTGLISLGLRVSDGLKKVQILLQRFEPGPDAPYSPAWHAWTMWMTKPGNSELVIAGVPINRRLVLTVLYTIVSGMLYMVVSYTSNKQSDDLRALVDAQAAALAQLQLQLNVTAT